MHLCSSLSSSFRSSCDNSSNNRTIITHANDVVLWHRYRDHFVMMCVCVYVSMIKKNDWNDLKLSTVVVLNSLSKPTDFGFKRSR